MEIRNQTKNILLEDRAKRAGTFFERLKGLIGKNHIESSEALLLPNCSMIHTFFMAMKIGLLFLDKNNKVIKVIRSMPPFEMSSAMFKSVSVIELQAGTIERTHTDVGDSLSIEADKEK